MWEQDGYLLGCLEPTPSSTGGTLPWESVVRCCFWKEVYSGSSGIPSPSTSPSSYNLYICNLSPPVPVVSGTALAMVTSDP